MSEIISKIKSKYILQMIFSHINYNKLLKITKYNKNIQNKLEINFDLFQKWSSYQYYKKTTFEDTRQCHDGLEDACKYFFSGICTFIIFIYILIFASLVVAKGAFDEKNTKTNYNKNYSKIIDKINYSLFGFLAYIIISYILIFVWATFDCYTDYGIKKLIKKISIIFLAIIYLFYEVLIIIKLYLSYKIKKDETTWFMLCDYILIILIFLYIIFIVIFISIYFSNAGNSVAKRKKIILTKFRDIEINNFNLPDDFNKWNKTKKKEFILNNKNRYIINITENEKDLVSLINKYRKENNIDELVYDKKIFFDELIIDKYSEHILVKNENIFKLSNTNYLFRYPVGEFAKKFNERNKDIINILLKVSLNKIIIIIKNNIEFINIFKLQKTKSSLDIDSHCYLPSEVLRLRDRGRSIGSKSKYYES